MTESERAFSFCTNSILELLLAVRKAASDRVTIKATVFGVPHAYETGFFFFFFFFFFKDELLKAPRHRTKLTRALTATKLRIIMRRSR